MSNEMQPEIKEFTVNLAYTDPHKISYTEWGSGDKLLVCVHGLTRNGRDFDWIAKALASDYRIICPDMPGRGKSEWLKNWTLYNNAYYVEIIKAMIEELGFKQVDWLGTSMGGLIGMIMAATKPGIIHKMVINDIGPYIDASGMRRIATYVREEVKFPTREAGEKRMREIYSQFNYKEDEWPHIFDHGLRQTSDGQWSFNHDPNIGAGFKDKDGATMEIGEYDLWRIWSAIKIPVLVLRGASSDILSREVAEKMLERSETELVEFTGYGHVPPLINDEQINVVRKFLL